MKLRIRENRIMEKILSYTIIGLCELSERTGNRTTERGGISITPHYNDFLQAPPIAISELPTHPDNRKYKDIIERK